MTRRRGFTVLEIVVAIFLMALLTAAIIPALMGRIRDAQSAALSQTLFSLGLAVFEYRKAVSVNPSQLVQLAAKPSSTDDDACGANIGVNNVNNWRGPYVSRELLSAGVGIGDARISNQLSRVTAGSSTTLFIDVEFVDAQAAVDIDRAYDGATDTPTTGTVRYTTAAVVRTSPPSAANITYAAPPAGMVTLSYGIPITGC